jgi:hypothetical protein
VSFISTLSSSELSILREIVRKVHLTYVDIEFATERECDKMIDGMGPETVDKMLRFGRQYCG